MRMRFFSYVEATPRGVLMAWFFAGAYANIFGLLTALNTTYSNSAFTIKKWIGALIGFLTNSFMLVLMCLLFDCEPWGGVVLVGYYISLIIFNIIYRKKIRVKKGDYYNETGHWHIP